MGGVNVCEEDLNNYTGFKEISGNTEFINEYMSNIYSQWFTNQYIIIKTMINIKRDMMEKVCFVKTPPSIYKGKNHLQRGIGYINKDITIVAILGGYGREKLFSYTNGTV